MSFQQGSALESQPTTWRREDDPQYADDPAFQAYSAQLSDKLFSLTSNITRLSQQVGLLGTKKETERVRERVHEIIDDTNSSFKDIGEGLKKITTWPDIGPSQKFTQSKLNREFKASLSEFQHLQRQAIDKQKATAAASRAALEHATSPTDEHSPFAQGQQQEQEQLRLAPQDDVDFQESLIIERESEIRNIEQSVSELNELFKDVAHMVHEQGEQLDIIEENVFETRDAAEGASKNLTQANRYQKNARSKACILLLILAIVLVIIILAVVLD
ncbi:t-SNARE [Amniculicola lignicola CBS 123094]|uniref:t-SNARE n=1 Tax=Amniculicola lignicola CBS 123094 TaxID=1392246 RepID=A0A6A5WUF1_9PLEO|nr:t-SNARE [Amniculicola lignicola CBS 123094]